MKKRLVIVSLLSLILAGCSTATSIKQNVEDKAQDVAMGQAVNLECTKVDQDTCTVITAQMRSFSRPATMTSTTGETKSETKLDGRGNMQIMSNQEGKEASNMIVFNGMTYIKDYQDNQWMKLTNTEGDSAFDMKAIVDDVKESFSEENTKLTVKKLGEEACDALTCAKYETYESDTPDEKTIVWIDTKDTLVRKMETANGETTSVTTYVYEPVAISEPSPVKEFTIPKFGE